MIRRYQAPFGWAVAVAFLLCAAPAWGQTDDRLVLCLDPLNMPYSEVGMYPPGFDMEIGKSIAKAMGRPSAI